MGDRVHGLQFDLLRSQRVLRLCRDLCEAGKALRKIEGTVNPGLFAIRLPLTHEKRSIQASSDRQVRIVLDAARDHRLDCAAIWNCVLEIRQRQFVSPFVLNPFVLNQT